MAYIEAKSASVVAAAERQITYLKQRRTEWIKKQADEHRARLASSWFKKNRELAANGSDEEIFKDVDSWEYSIIKSHLLGPIGRAEALKAMAEKADVIQLSQEDIWCLKDFQMEESKVVDAPPPTA